MEQDWSQHLVEKKEVSPAKAHLLRVISFYALSIQQKEADLKRTRELQADAMAELDELNKEER